MRRRVKRFVLRTVLNFAISFVLAQAPQNVTKEERIAALEAEMAALNARSMTTTAAAYGI